MPGFEGPIYVALRPSASLAHVLLAAHAAAVAAIAFLFSVTLPQLALIAAIGFNGAASLWTLRRRRPNDVTALLLTSHDGWQVSLRDVRQIGASLAATPYVTRKITVLPLKLDDGTVKRVVLLPDGIDPDAFRRLRVRLRFNVA